jgi:hypothetical protein
MNYVQSDFRNELTDEICAACVTLKRTSLEPDVSALAAMIQNQTPH